MHVVAAPVTAIQDIHLLMPDQATEWKSEAENAPDDSAKT